MVTFNNFSDNKTRGLGDKNKHKDNVHNLSNKKTKASDIVDLSNDIDDDDDDVKYFVPNFDDKRAGGSNSNSYIVLVYPMGEEDLDCITIRECDVNRLDKFVYLNDSLIDLQVKIDIEECALERRDKVHAFNCFFIPRLKETKNEFSSIARWTKKLNLWMKDFIFIPINEDNHWSLIVVVRPYLCLTHQAISDSEGDRPCLLVMDSLGMHDPTKFSKIIKDYLVNELKYRHSSEVLSSKYTDSDIERFTMNIQDLKFYKVPIPRQSNGYDCGIYVVKYVRYVLDIWS